MVGCRTRETERGCVPSLPANGTRDGQGEEDAARPRSFVGEATGGDLLRGGVKKTQLAQGLLVGESDGWRTAAEGSDRPGSWSQDGAVKEDATRPGSIHGNRLGGAAATWGMKKTQFGPGDPLRIDVGSCEGSGQPAKTSSQTGAW